MTIGTKTSAIRSASRSIGAFEPCARRTSSTIRASAVSRPTRVARITNVPVVLRVAPMTSSPGPTVDRDRLAGQHRGVDGRAAVDDQAIDRHLVAGPDAQQVAGLDVVERDLDVGPLADEPRGRRAEPDQAADGAGRTCLRPGLEPASEQDEPDDDRRGVEVGHRFDAGRCDDVRPQRDDHAVRPGGARPDGDQRVHVGRAVACGSPRRPVEAAAGPDLDERRGQQDQPVELGQPDRRLRREHHQP